MFRECSKCFWSFWSLELQFRWPIFIISSSNARSPSVRGEQIMTVKRICFVKILQSKKPCFFLLGFQDISSEPFLTKTRFQISVMWPILKPWKTMTKIYKNATPFVFFGRLEWHSANKSWSMVLQHSLPWPWSSRVVGWSRGGQDIHRCQSPSSR